MDLVHQGRIRNNKSAVMNLNNNRDENFDAVDLDEEEIFVGQPGPSARPTLPPPGPTASEMSRPPPGPTAPEMSEDILRFC